MKPGIEIDAAFYRGYLVDDRSLARHVAALAMIVALWSLVYLVGCFAPLAKQPTPAAARHWAAIAVRR